MSASSSALSTLFQWCRSNVASTAQDPRITRSGNTPLCRRCIAIFQKSSKIQSQANKYLAFGEVHNFRLYIDPRDFLEAAERGCFVCVRLKSCLEDSVLMEFLEKRNPWTSVFEVKMHYVTKSDQAPEMTFSIGSQFHPARTRFRLVKAVADQHIPGLEYKVPVNSGSPHALHLATFWLRDCLANHPSCGPFATGTKSNVWLPTRLVQITPLGARLCTREAVPVPISPYATLSHCWGRKQIFRTLKDNIEGLYRDIPLYLLPKAFLDVITVCRAMDLTYVWIDSLCIIQDSIEDWAKEAKEMGNVYKHCLVNIAATGFEGGEKGFFADRDPEEVRSFEVHSEGSDFVENGTFHLVWTSKWQKEVLTAPLNTRGWVFQERLFSPRVLSFGAREVFWECKERESCESYPQEFPVTGGALGGQISEQKTFKSRNPLDDLKIVASKNREDDQKEGGEYIWEFWCTIVELYSGTKLTNETDKLIAISGVVDEMSKILGSECLAGIWRVYLLPQLLWEVPQSQYEKVTIPVTPQAPSWSWASLNTRVNARNAVPNVRSENRTTGHLSTLLSASVSTDPLGFFKSGELQIRGPLMTAAMELDDLHIGSRYLMKFYDMPRLRIYVRRPLGVEYIWINVLLKPDNVRDWDQAWAPYFQDPGESTKEHSDLDLAQWPKLMSSRTGFPKTIFLLPLVSRTSQEVGDNSEVEESDRTEFLGLILLPTGNSDGVFKRVGMFMSYDPEDTRNNDLEDISHETLAIRTDNYNSCEGINQFVVTIV